MSDRASIFLKYSLDAPHRTMKSIFLLELSFLSFYASSASPLLILPDLSFKALKRTSGLQIPIMPLDVPGILMPGSSGESNKAGSDELSISDVIGKERIINIFAGFTREITRTSSMHPPFLTTRIGDIESISKRLDDSSKNTTVLAPLNSGLQRLPRKPWEDPEDHNTLGAGAYKGEEGEDRAYQNLRRFVEAHIVPVSPWQEGEKVQTVGGGMVWWEHKDGLKMVRVVKQIRPRIIDLVTC